VAAHACTVAVPLLGAGARGAPVPEVSTVAASAVARWEVPRGSRELEVRFAVQEEAAADELLNALDVALGNPDDSTLDGRHKAEVELVGSNVHSAQPTHAPTTRGVSTGRSTTGGETKAEA
jgi:hypothetical protein